METETQTGEPGEDRGRDWGDMATSQGTSRLAQSLLKVGRGKKRFLPRVLRGSMALPHLGFRPLASKIERTNFCYFKPSNLLKFV